MPKTTRREAMKIAAEMAGVEYEEQDQTFIWDEEKVIKNRVFPMDVINGEFFYGLLLPKEVDEKDKKGEIIGRKQITFPALIKSNKSFMPCYKNVMQEKKISFQNLPSYLPSRWSLSQIKMFLDKETTPVNPKELLESIENQYKKYVAIRNPTWYKIMSCWDIGTYFYMLFEAYPFLENRGIAGTGKTKSMTVSSYITFNGGQIMANPSEATLFREKDEVRGTTYFDEAEKLWVYNKATNQYEGDARTELINASYTQEAKVPRQEKIGNKFVTKWYSPYGPTQLSSINGLYGATETRAITRICTKSSNDDSRGEVEPTEDKGQEIWGNIRDKCYRFGLDNWKEVKELYNEFDKEIGLKRRDYQIWKPILTIARFIDKEIYEEILEFAISLTKIKMDDLIQESSFDYTCLSAMKITIESCESDKVYVNAIKRNYCALKDDQEGLKNTYLNRNISNHLDKLGFKELRSRDKNASFFAVTKDIFDEIVSPICPNLSFLNDQNEKKVAMMAIDGENVDTWENEKQQKTPEKQQKEEDNLSTSSTSSTSLLNNDNDNSVDSMGIDVDDVEIVKIGDKKEPKQSGFKSAFEREMGENHGNFGNISPPSDRFQKQKQQVVPDTLPELPTLPQSDTTEELPTRSDILQPDAISASGDKRPGEDKPKDAFEEHNKKTLPNMLDRELQK